MNLGWWAMLTFYSVFGVVGMAQANQPYGKVMGSVSFLGSIPEEEILEVSRDQAVCGESRSFLPIRVNPANQGLHQALVSIKGSTFPSTQASAQSRLLANSECRFSPHVSAAQVGDRLEVHNRDPILHNTHISRNKRTFLNVAQLPGSRPIPKVIKQEGSYSIQCDKHKFMRGILQVFSHPYFMVTDSLGTFELPPLPAGKYTLQVWHERLGVLEEDIQVPPTGTVTVKFDYH